jgi:hypothetical protein
MGKDLDFLSKGKVVWMGGQDLISDVIDIDDDRVFSDGFDLAFEEVNHEWNKAMNKRISTKGRNVAIIATRLSLRDSFFSMFEL